MTVRCKKVFSFLMSVVLVLYSICFLIPQNVVHAYDNLYYGIDVSSNQGNINWNTISQYNLNFCIVRAGSTLVDQNTYYNDVYFEKNYAGAKEIGLKVGAYYYCGSSTLSDFQSNAQSFVNSIRGKQFDYPVYIDLEQSKNQMSLGKEVLTDYILEALRIIRESGYTCGVYANYSWFTNYIDRERIVNSGYEIWVARWINKSYVGDPTQFDRSDIGGVWQYSSVGTMNGIGSKTIDLDVSYLDYDLGQSPDLPCKIEISGFQQPQKGYVHTPGANCGLYGTIYSNHPLTRVRGGVFNLDGTPAPGQSTVCDESASGTSYSLRGTFNNTIIFDDIPEGYYYFSIWVWDNDGFDKEIIHNNFKVGDPPLPTEPVPQGSPLSEADGAGQTLPDGDYQIFSGINPFYYLDIEGADVPAISGTNVTMYTVEETAFLGSYDTWTLEYLNNGFYRIKQMGTTMCLDVADALLDRGTNVQICSQNDSFAQQWSIIRTSNGYKIQSRCNGYFLDVCNGEYAAGTNVWVWEGNDTAAQNMPLFRMDHPLGRPSKMVFTQFCQL